MGNLVNFMCRVKNTNKSFILGVFRNKNKWVVVLVILGYK